MDGTHVPIATAAITAVRPKRLCRAAIPPKIGFASSNRMLVSPSTTYFHSRWMGDANSAYRPADAAACSSSARIRATLRWLAWTGNLRCGLAGPEGRDAGEFGELARRWLEAPRGQPGVLRGDATGRSLVATEDDAG